MNLVFRDSSGLDKYIDFFALRVQVMAGIRNITHNL